MAARRQSTGDPERFSVVVRGGAWQPSVQEHKNWMSKSEPSLLKGWDRGKKAKAGPRQRGVIPLHSRKLNPSNSASCLRKHAKESAALRAMRVPATGGHQHNYPLYWHDSFHEAFEILHGNRLQREHDGRMSRGGSGMDQRPYHPSAQGYVSTRAKTIPGELGVHTHTGEYLHTRRSRESTPLLSSSSPSSPPNLPVYLQDLVPRAFPTTKPLTVTTTLGPTSTVVTTIATSRSHQPALTGRRKSSDPSYYCGEASSRAFLPQTPALPTKTSPVDFMYDPYSNVMRYSPRSSTANQRLSRGFNDPFLKLTGQECKQKKLALRREETQIKRMARIEGKEKQQGASVATMSSSRPLTTTSLAVRGLGGGGGGGGGVSSASLEGRPVTCTSATLPGMGVSASEPVLTSRTDTREWDSGRLST